MLALLLLASPALATGELGSGSPEGYISVLRNLACGVGAYVAAATPPAAIGVAIACLLMVLDP